MAMAVAARTARRRGLRRVVLTAEILRRGDDPKRPTTQAQHADGTGSKLQDALRILRMQGRLPDLDVCPTFRLSGQNPDEHGTFGGKKGREGASVGFFVRLGLLCGSKWDYCADNGSGWRGSSHSSTSIRLLSMSTSDGLRRNSRVLTRREEPAHGSGPLPGRLRRRPRAGQGHRALRRAVEAGRLRRIPGGGARGHAPALAGRAQAAALLLGELDAR